MSMVTLNGYATNAAQELAELIGNSVVEVIPRLRQFVEGYSNGAVILEVHAVRHLTVVHSGHFQRVSFLNKEGKREWTFVVQNRKCVVEVVRFNPEFASEEYCGLGCPCCNLHTRWIYDDELGRLREFTREEHEALLDG